MPLVQINLKWYIFLWSFNKIIQFGFLPLFFWPDLKGFVWKLHFGNLDVVQRSCINQINVSINLMSNSAVLSHLRLKQTRVSRLPCSCQIRLKGMGFASINMQNSYQPNPASLKIGVLFYLWAWGCLPNKKAGLAEIKLAILNSGKNVTWTAARGQSWEEVGRLDAIAFPTLSVTICPHFCVAIYVYFWENT